VSDVYDDESGEAFDEEQVPPARPRNRSGSPPPEAEQLLKRVLDTIAGARPMPLSASVMINRDEVVEMLEEAVARLPEELRAARWLLKEREEFLSKVRREGEDILEQARTRAERMVQRTEVVKAADTRARQIVDRAEDQARRMRLECEDFCDQKLASFEIVLERTQKLVAAGRTKLQGKAAADLPPDGDERAADERPARSRRAPVFDQEA
jgi:F0F1-type ATP synthase membrane subunit b/b'